MLTMQMIVLAHIILLRVEDDWQVIYVKLDILTIYDSAPWYNSEIFLSSRRTYMYLYLQLR